jgi:hypothetical protein
VVTTVEVTPTAPTVSAGDTVRLTATVKDQHGAVISGKTPIWTPTNPAIATVSADGLVTGVAQGQTTIAAAVEGKQGSAALTVTAPVRIELDVAAAQTATLGPAGGTITATAANGLVYVLDVPRMALDSAVQISMTPIKQFKLLPFSGGSVGAVELAPAGLRFHAPVTLRIKTSPAVPAGQKLVAMYYKDGGDLVLPGPARQGAGEITVLIAEIGITLGGSPSPSQAAMLGAAASGTGVGAGAALATPQNLSALPPPATSPANLIAQINLASLSMPADQAGIEGVLRTWFRRILPEIQGATTDALLFEAIIEYWTWTNQISSLDLPGKPLEQALAPELRQAETELLTAFKSVMAALNQECTANRSLLAANNILQLYAEIGGVGVLHLILQSGVGLPEAELLNQLCIKVVVTDSTLPAPLPPNTPAQLDLRFGIKFGADPNLTANVPFTVELVKAGTTQDGTEHAATNSLGRYSSPVTATGQTSVILSGKTCIDAAAGVQLDVVCVTYQIDRAFGRTITANVTVLSDAGLAQIADVGKIVGNLTISGANVTSTDLRELSLLSEVTGNLTLQQLPAVTTLAGMRSLTRVRGLLLLGNPQLRNPGIPAGLTDLFLLQVLGGGFSDLSGFFGLAHIGNLSLSGIQLATLDPLRRTVIDQSLLLDNVTGLTSLDGLNLSPTALQSLILGRNPDLADLAALSVLTEVEQVILLLPPSPTMSGLQNLRRVAVFNISPSPRSVDYTFPALQDVSHLIVSFTSADCQGRSAPFVLGLPALQSLTSLTYHGTQSSAPNCFAGFPASVSNLPLESVIVGGGGLRSLTIKQVSNAPVVNGNLGIQIGSLDLTHLSFTGPVDINGRMWIGSNAVLPSISFGGSVRVRGSPLQATDRNLSLCNNPLLTTVSFAGSIQVTGSVMVANNPLLKGTGTWPLTATGPITITSAFNATC